MPQQQPPSTVEKKSRLQKLKATFGRVLTLARPEAGTIALATVFLAVGSASSLAFPKAIGLMVDAADRNKQLFSQAADVAAQSVLLGRLNLFIVVLLVIFVVQGIAIALRYTLFSLAGERVVARLRGDLFKSLMSQDVAFFDSQKTGDLTSRLSADTATLQSTVSSNISMALRNLAMVVGGIGALFYTSPRLTFVMLSVVPPVALGAMAYGRRVRKLSKESQDALAAANASAEEGLSGIRTVRSFDAEGAEVTRYRTAIGASFDLAKKRIANAATFMGVASFAAYAAAAAVLWYGARLVVAGNLSLGALVSFLVYSMQVAFSLGGLSELWADFNRATGAAERVFELLERTPTVNADGGAVPAHIEGRVAWETVDFAYPTRADVSVLKHFSLELKPGEVVALVGPSGAGKSTIASLLYRLYDPQGGAVKLDGADLKTLDPHWLRRQIGVVAQEPLLFSASVEENIRYGRPEATAEEVERAAKLANAHGFITRFPEGYKTLVGERGVQLSGGQKQRVAIARAVLKDPRLLILDEATSALDAESEHLVREALERLMEGRTTLVIAHRLSTVKGADRVVVLDQGAVAQSGTHATLLTQDGIYRRLVEKQFEAA